MISKTDLATLVTTRELQERYRVCRKTIHLWCKQGRIPPDAIKRISSSTIRFDLEMVVRALEGQEAAR